jgi:hypothetical protein
MLEESLQKSKISADVATQEREFGNQSSLMELKGKLDKDMLVTSEDYKTIAANKEQEFKLAIQSGDYQNASKLQKEMGEIKLQSDEADRVYRTSERIASQGWQTGERIGAQDAQKAIKALDYDMALALQNDDQEAVSAIENKKNLLALKIQTQELSHDTAMTKLTAQLAEAKANNDVGRTKTIAQYQSTLDLNEMAKKQGYEVALQNNQGNIQKALQAGEFAQAQAIQQAQHIWQANQNMQDRAISKAEQEMRAKGYDVDNMVKMYEAAKSAGDDAGALAILNNGLSSTGVKLSPPDPFGAAQAALDADFAAQKYQYALTHPGAWDAVNKKMTPEGEAAFAQWFNTNTYGNVDKITNIIADVNNTTGGKDNPTTDSGKNYATVAAKAVDWAPSVSLDRKGMNTKRFDNPPSIGTAIKNGGRVLTVTSSPAQKTVRFGDDYEYFTAVDINTGETITIKSIN